MAESDDEVPPLLAALRDDVVDVDWHSRLTTMLLTVGIGAFGAMLGIHWYATAVFNAIPPQTATELGVFDLLQSQYHSGMELGMVVAAVSLAVAVYRAQRRE